MRSSRQYDTCRIIQPTKSPNMCGYTSNCVDSFQPIVSPHVCDSIFISISHFKRLIIFIFRSFRWNLSRLFPSRLPLMRDFRSSFFSHSDDRKVTNSTGSFQILQYGSIIQCVFTVYGCRCTVLEDSDHSSYNEDFEERRLKVGLKTFSRFIKIIATSQCLKTTCFSCKCFKKLPDILQS